MSKKKKTLTIDQDYAIISAANNLIKAEEIAEVSGDLDILLAVSDRWINLYAVLADIEASDTKIGFAPEKLGEEYGGETGSEGSYKSKSRFKVRKKSR